MTSPCTHSIVEPRAHFVKSHDEHVTWKLGFLVSSSQASLSLPELVPSVKACLVMAGRFLALVLLFWGSFSAMVNGKCPCEDQSLCEPIARPPGKEFLMFSTKPNVWKKYDWTKVTTIALFRPWDDELMCEAHKRVRNQLSYSSVILLTLFTGLLLWWRSTKSVLSRLERNLVVIFFLDARWQFLTSVLWNLQQSI